MTISLKKFKPTFDIIDSRKFELVSDYSPSGDQPKAIENLCKGLTKKQNDQVLLGVTGSGKTFTMANVISKLQSRSALVFAPNKILAAQLFSEMKNFFPNNAVEYFVSYYDYYTPEAPYVPRTDTYIEKNHQLMNKLIGCDTLPQDLYWKGKIL